jgi:hypothetical protein
MFLNPFPSSKEPVLPVMQPEGMGLGYIASLEEELAPSPVVAILQVPSTFSDDLCLSLVGSFGVVVEYARNLAMRQCYVRLQNAEQADAMINYYQENLVRTMMLSCTIMC